MCREMLFIDFLEELFAAECYFGTQWRIYCPGCGGTRALEALLHGRVIESLKYNPIVILFLIDVMVTEILELFEKRRKEIGKTAEFRRKINSGLLIFIFLFSLFRNYILHRYGIDMLGDFS